MDFSQHRRHLLAEAASLKSAAVAAGGARVPTCPEWTGLDLLAHITEVYEHKTAAIRHGGRPEPWPTEREPVADPADRFDAALAELVAEMDARGPDAPAWSWYEPDQTVGFWGRRLACETVVHRADAELALGRPIGPVDPALAFDAIDEFFQAQVVWPTRRYNDELREPLERHAGLAVAIAAGDRSWKFRVAPEGVTVSEGGDGGVDATVAGSPRQTLMWLWRRLPTADLAVAGDTAKAGECYDLFAEFTD
jgi:uncharacterized protein (TIGR03083 family)